MRGKVIILLVVGIAVSLWAITALPQAEEQKAQLYMVMEEVVKPSEVGEYEEAVKEFFALCAKHNFPYSFYASSTVDFHYYFLMPVENFAAIDDFKNAAGEYIKKLGAEQYLSLAKRITGAWQYVQHTMYYQMPELSYTPENPRLKPEERNFYNLAFLYIQFGKEKEFEKILKEWVDLYKAKNIADGYNLWVGDIGVEKPIYVVISAGKSPADYFSQSEKNDKLLREEAKALLKKTLALVRKYEFKIGWSRPDLSYMPQEENPTK